MNIKERVNYLREEINRYNYYYYERNESIISDIEFDKLLKELEKLEKENPELKTSKSPTENVGGSLKDSKFKKITHRVPMLSLSNTYNMKDLENFDTRLKRILTKEDMLKELEYVLELKLDGLSISVIYEEGKLKQAITRGDGKIGEDVTENILEIKSIPKYLKEPLSIEVRGEIVLPISEFNKLNEKRKIDGEEPFANPRNAASGTLRQLESSIVKDRNLDCYFYYLVDSEKLGIKTHSESIDRLASVGFKTTGVCQVVSSIDKLEEKISYWEEEKKNLDYETDGLVIKVNETELYPVLGTTTKAPRWAISYKFPAKQVTTKLTGVTWQVGRTGKVTPVAELEEAIVSGSKVKRASLHNYDEILRKDIKIGDRVFIEKAAEIIPQVVKVVKEVRTGQEIEILEPETCPVCDSKLHKEEGIVDLKCLNYNCLAKVQGRIEYFVSRDAMNIDGLGKKIIEKFIELEKISDVSDIYSLHKYREELENLDKMGEKSVTNLFNSIEESKKREYSKDKVLTFNETIKKHVSEEKLNHFYEVAEIINELVSNKKIYNQKKRV